jgi:hypothetical protein
MKPSRIDLNMLLQAKLLEFPALVTKLEERDLAAVDHLLTWMKKVEEILKVFGATEAAEIAGFRSKILAPKFSDDRMTNSRKHQLKAVAESMFEIEHTVLQIAKPIEDRAEECRAVIQQMLTIMRLNRLVTYDAQRGVMWFAQILWESFPSYQQLHSGIVKLKASFALPDILKLIAAEIDVEEWDA